MEHVITELWSLHRKALANARNAREAEGPSSLRALGWGIEAGNCLAAIGIMQDQRASIGDKSRIMLEVRYQ